MPRTDTVIVKASAPEDLIALAAHTLGFWPEESLVLVSLRGPRRRTGLVARTDLPPLLAEGARGPGAVAHVARQLAAPVVADGASAAAVVLFTRTGGAGQEHRGLAAALDEALGARGVQVAEAVLVDGQRLFSLSCSPECCPDDGRELGEVWATQVGAEMVARGSTVAADRPAVVAALRAGVAPAPEPDREEVEGLVAAAAGRDPWAPGRAERAARTWCALLDAAVAAPTAGSGRAGGAGEPAARTPDEAAAAVLDPGCAAALLADLEHLLVRDVVLVSVVPGARAALRAPAGSAFRADSGLAGRLLDALELQAAAEDAGEPEELEAAEALVRRLVRLAPDHLRAGPLAVLAYWGWWRGSTVAASTLAEEALRAEPGHALAGMVLQMATHGLAPDWVRRRRGAQPGGSQAGAPRSAARDGARRRGRRHPRARRAR